MADRCELTVRSQTGDYRVVVGPGTLNDALDSPDHLVLADRYFEGRLDPLPGSVIWIDATEENKTLRSVEALVVGARQASARRETVIVAIGGGVVQDLATLTAALYMRGVRWRYVPTTLMAMADSCIGGKSSINVGGMKNLVGNIYPPVSIAIDPRFLASLTPEQTAAGLSEAVKICFCAGEGPFDRYLALLDQFREGDATPLLAHVLDTKRWFVEVDEFDRAERRLLNFGHTFGHAIEAATAFSVSHGVAVSLGMICALLFDPDRTRGNARADSLHRHCCELVGMVDDLEKQLVGLDRRCFEEAFRSDKKHRPDEFHLILPADRGVEEVAVRDDGSSFAAVQRALERTLDEVMA
jgi:3-dehydroquinate synthase